jgi:hypothetical protein
MKRSKFGVLLVLSSTLCGGIGAAHAQDATAQTRQTLPLRDVVLFSSGVGYFGRAGRVNGDATVGLSFRTEQVNDILKSLVLFDPAGNVRPVTYTTKDSLARRLGAAGMSVGNSVTLGALLRQFQGTRVRLETGGEAVEGRILSVSLKTVPIALREGGVVQAGAVQIEVVNVLTTGGLRAVSLEGVTQVKLLDERLDRELRESLELLATGLDDKRRAVELRFGGNSAREVRAGYLLEMPVWKTSYRLVLDEKGEKNQKPYVQGWAIVENTTDEDWKDVRLSLVSGRPISFIQDLYQPLYVPRPLVQAQVIGSPLPQTYGAAFDLPAGVDKMVAIEPQNGLLVYGLSSGVAPSTPANKPSSERSLSSADARSSPRRSREDEMLNERAQEARREARLSAENLAQSVASQAQGAERGELFEYAIRQAVTLPRQQAAMVPIVSEYIGGEKLSIYDVNSTAKNALNGFRLKNTTGLHLSGGPVAVYSGGVYAGDAQINNLQPGEDRLISYAVDLDLLAAHEEPRFRQDTLSFSAKSGVLTITHKQRREQVYTFRNKSDAAKTVLVQQDIEPDFKLVEPAKPAQKTAEEYRFKVEAPAKKTVELKVVTERPVTETIALIDADLDMMVQYARNTQTSPALRAALEQLVTRRRKITGLQGQRAALESELKAIDQEQSRIRQNMEQLDRNSALYNQYVKKLTAQETRIEKLRQEIARLREGETAAEKELRDFTDNLTV